MKNVENHVFPKTSLCNHLKKQSHLDQWRNLVPGCPWVPLAQSGIDAIGTDISGTTQLTQGWDAQAWVPPKPGCPQVCPP